MNIVTQRIPTLVQNKKHVATQAVQDDQTAVKVVHLCGTIIEGRQPSHKAHTLHKVHRYQYCTANAYKECTHVKNVQSNHFLQGYYYTFSTTKHHFSLSSRCSLCVDGKTYV
jgi:hypothetical protein